MPDANPDNRTLQRRTLDEAIASEAMLPPPELPMDATTQPLESLLMRSRHPVAVAGIVENGVVRPLDPSVRLPERARVVIVAAVAR